MGYRDVLVESDSAVLNVTFNRPDKLNALTWSMCDGLMDACEQADSDDQVRVMVLRGAGDRAFMAGADAGLLMDITSPEDGLAYEENMNRVFTRLEMVRVPTVAAVRGYCVGGGLALAAICDLRIATESARFGVPIARTFGNCLSLKTYAMLVYHFGPSRTLDLLLRARLLSSAEAQNAGFISEVCDDAGLDHALSEFIRPLLNHAPLTMWAAKEANRRIRQGQPDGGDDILLRVYGSHDFAQAVRAFAAKEPVVWSGE
jgi:enoyl-CoA hydratase/carnithine racemase